MPRPYTPYIPQDINELRDLLGSMLLGAPTFTDDSGYFPERSIHTEFQVLEGGLLRVREAIGEERYTRLTKMAGRTKSYFEEAVGDEADEVWAGRNLLLEMEDVLNEVRRSR